MLIDDIKNGENDQLEFKEIPSRDSAWPNAVRAVIYRCESPKADIESPKADIESPKADIEGLLSSLKGKTRLHAAKVAKNALGVDFFKRSHVMSWTGLSHTAASAFLDNLLRKSIIKPVVGHGKGAYRFVVRCGV